MSIFETIMLLCFGAAWPFSIYKSVKYKKVEGKSLIFMIIVLIGYISGIFHKILYSYDKVIYLYILNSLLVSADIILFLRLKK
jgi:hypothetical protein